MEDGEKRPKRQKRDSSYRAKAFEKFKQLKSGNRNKYEVEELDNVYDTVDEKEYTKRVLSRQDDDWIVDDDGSGYVEDGRDIFDDDLDHQSIAAAAAASSAAKGKGIKRKKKGIADNSSKGNLQYLLSNMPAKKKEDDKLEDQILTELLSEIETMPVQNLLQPKSGPSNFSPLDKKQEEIEYMKNLVSSKKVAGKRHEHKVTATEFLQNIIDENEWMQQEIKANGSDVDNNCSVEVQQPIECSKPACTETIQTPSRSKSDVLEKDCFNDDLDLSEVGIEFETDANKDDTWEKAEEEFKQIAGQSDCIDNTESPVDLENSDVPLIKVDNKKVFRFFWWDAFEDVSKQPGVVFLFGKTYHEKAKGFVSCCVAVRNIERHIFFLPRTKEKDSEKTVTCQDVYKEINESTMKDINVKQFKAKVVTKKYAFDPQIPSESEYVEVRYSAKNSRLVKSIEGNTFSRVFGTETSFLEILLLDRKIKGPCWLDISNPVPETNPVTWCKFEINCNKASDVVINTEINKPPPLIITSINLRTAANPKTGTREIVMLSCVTNVSYSVDKPVPDKPFQKHFCVFTCPSQQVFPIDLFTAMRNYKATTLQKMDSEKGVLNFFINRFEQIDSDLIVGHDLHGYQMALLTQRLLHYKIPMFSKLGRVKRTIFQKNLEKSLFVGRLVCDVKISAKELIRCRSYDLDTLCQSILKVKDGQRIDLEPEYIAKMFRTSSDILKLVSLTMQDTAYILGIMYNLNIIPLALQITKIAGNTMSKTLLGGRAERNEFLLLHAFSEKNYIVPDKNFDKKNTVQSEGSKKKPTYSGGLVLEPKAGFYDKLILLLDFNSLYPSIIQEYNLCFTTMASDLSEENMVLPDSSLPPGVLPSEIRKLVESRRAVKKLMDDPKLSSDMKMQYHIRQMALKLTANSMYGCLGFANSRFYAKNLAALITYKGREILMNTKDLVERLNYEVIYGDTDSLMINTNIVDYNQVFQIGTKIKRETNKLYKQVELDIDGVFKYLLLLKKKKYAAVTLSKDKNGMLKTEIEYKGIDIVRRDWSGIAAEAGKFVLNEILSDQSFDDKISNIMTQLRKLRDDLEVNKVPLSLLVITKQLTKNLNQYPLANILPHVQVARRYNSKLGGHLGVGDTVPYLICDDGSSNSATQRAYHVEEVRNSKKLVVDVKYYLSQQIYPVISRICEPIPELDLSQIGDCLGVEVAIKNDNHPKRSENDSFFKPENKFNNVDAFLFTCFSCNFVNSVEAPIINNVPVLGKCRNSQCNVRPADYVPHIKNQMVKVIRNHIDKYYAYEMYCEDPVCVNHTVRMPTAFDGKNPKCLFCKNEVLLKKYTERQLYYQLTYFSHIFDLSKLNKKPLLEVRLKKAYEDIKGTVDKHIKRFGYSIVCLKDIFSILSPVKIQKEVKEKSTAR